MNTKLKMGGLVAAVLLAGYAQPALAEEIEAIIPEATGIEETVHANNNTTSETSILEKSAEQTPASVNQEAPAENNASSNQAGENAEPDYSADEKLIEDYNDKERYRTTELEPGKVNQEMPNVDEGKEKDGFKFDTLNPSEGSPSKTEYGYEIIIDKKTGQRTYTKIAVTDTGRIPVNTGDKPMLGEGEKLTPDSPDVTYKPDEDGEITGRPQKEYNYDASEETLKHINNKDNNSTVIGMKDNYTQDNPGNKYFKGDSFLITYKVNPWPNENDKLQLIKLSGESKGRFFVQGQDVDTGVKVENLDDSARDRLVGQVYNPLTGKIVQGASAYIDENGIVKVKLPAGAVNEDGTLNKDSVFNTPEFKGIQSLDVKFFARPRTAGEFKTIAETPDEYGETGTYVETGAGTGTINHKGTDVTIDKQGIDRYDHYNLIGNFKLNLDDTRYYNQKFQDDNKKDTSEHVSSTVKPGENFEVDMYIPAGSEEYNSAKDNFTAPRTGEQMEAAKQDGLVASTIDHSFIDKANEGKEEADQWKLTYDNKTLPTKFTITPPKSAKAGDFVAVPLTYTYTNGSTDVHWFHFVVQESDNNRPEYLAKTGYQGDTLTSTPEVPENANKNTPVSYELVDGEYKDSLGNTWTDIKVDKNTGAVTATVPKDAKIKGGENLFVTVKVNYKDEDGTLQEEYVKAQFFAMPKYTTEVTKEYDSKIPFETKVVYDNTLAAGTVVEKAGEAGVSKTIFKQVVINDKKGIIDENGNFQEGKEAVKVEITKDAVNGEIRIGTKPAENTVEIPRGLDYELDYSRIDGEPEVVDEGTDGVVTITTSRDPQTGEIKITKTTTTEVKNKKIKIPAGTEGVHTYSEKIPFNYDIQFDPDFYTNYPDEANNYKVVTEGKVGSKITTWTIKNSKIVGEPKVEETDPINVVIKVGQKDFTGVVTHTETHKIPYNVEVRYNDQLPAGKSNVIQEGVEGSYDVEYKQNVKNGKADGELSKTESNRKDATPHIIEIGTKVETPENNYTKNVEVEIKYVYDDTKDKGVVEAGELVPGKVETKVIDKYNPETGKVEQSSEQVVTKAKQTVIVGTKDFTGTYKYDKTCPISPKVIVRENPEMEAGTKKIVQEGQDGSQTTHVSIDIRNGKVVEGSLQETPGEKKGSN